MRSTTSKTSSLVVISMKGTDKYKITDFLNTLSNSYLDRNLEEKEQDSNQYSEIHRQPDK